MSRMESGRNMNEQREVKEKKRISNRDLKRNCIFYVIRSEVINNCRNIKSD